LPATTLARPAPTAAKTRTSATCSTSWSAIPPTTLEVVTGASAPSQSLVAGFQVPSSQKGPSNAVGSVALRHVPSYE